MKDRTLKRYCVKDDLLNFKAEGRGESLSFKVEDVQRIVEKGT